MAARRSSRQSGAWLIQVASRRMTDCVRSEVARQRRETNKDDTFILLLMCCHPALTSSSAIALTLCAVGGLTTAEIANAFLVPEATVAQRISRAKQSIKASGVPFQLPPAGSQPNVSTSSCMSSI